MGEVFENLRTLRNHGDLAVYNVYNNTGLSRNRQYFCSCGHTTLLIVLMWFWCTLRPIPRASKYWSFFSSSNIMLFLSYHVNKSMVLPSLKRSWWYVVWDCVSYIMTWVEAFRNVNFFFPFGNCLSIQMLSKIPPKIVPHIFYELHLVDVLNILYDLGFLLDVAYEEE